MSTVLASAGDVMLRGMFPWHTLSPLMPTAHDVNTTGSLTVVDDHFFIWSQFNGSKSTITPECA